MTNLPASKSLETELRDEIDALKAQLDNALLELADCNTQLKVDDEHDKYLRKLLASTQEQLTDAMRILQQVLYDPDRPAKFYRDAYAFVTKYNQATPGITPDSSSMTSEDKE